MESELSITRFTFMNTWGIILNSRPFMPIQSLLIKLIHALIEAEPEPDKKMSEKVHWIYENTHLKVMLPISIIELAVFKNLDKGLNREIDIGDKTFNLTELYKILDEVTLELSRISIGIAKKYSFDIPISSFSQNTSMQKISID